MRRCYTGTQIRAAERPRLEAGEGPELMRRAAYGLAHHTLHCLTDRGRAYGSRVVGLIGKGNNGADTLFALGFLAQRGVHVTAIPVLAQPDDLHVQAVAAFLRAGGAWTNTIPTDTAVVLDGVFGTGFTGSFDLPGYLSDHHLSIPDTAAVIACDIVSGVLADTGSLPGHALAADLTVTFGAPKIGLLAETGAQYAGRLVTVDIGIGQELAGIPDPWWMAEPQDLRDVFGTPAWDAQKYSQGVLSVVAGSQQYPGAAVLVARAGLATGIGYLHFVAAPTDPVAQLVLQAEPQVVAAPTIPEKTSAIVLGPGLGDHAGQQVETSLARAAALHVPILIDASALDHLTPQHFLAHGPTSILTPHGGELARLIRRMAPELQSDSPVDQAAQLARRFGTWVVLKGATSYVFSPHGARSVHPATAPELATAGTGDTLAGILGAGLARYTADGGGTEHDLLRVLTAGVRLHALAGELAAADGGVVVSSLAQYILQAKRQGLE